MSFSQTGDVITQTGIDADLSGIAAMSGVTSVTTGDFTVYDMGINRLRVEGTLTINPAVNSLIAQDVEATNWVQVEVRSGGTINLGARTLQNGVYRYETGLVMQLERNESGAQDSQASFRVSSGGTCNFFSGTVRVGAAFSVMEGAFFNSFSQFAVIDAIDRAENNEFPRFRQRSTNTNINGLTAKRMVFAFINNPSQLSGLIPFHGSPAVTFSGAFPNNVFAVFRDYDAGGGNSVDINLRGRKWVRLINAVNGSDYVIGNAGEGVHQIRSEIFMTAVDADSNALTGWGWYAIDRDNGNRLANNLVNNNEDYRPDREYFSTESGGSADFTTNGGVLIAVNYRDGSTVTQDFRGANNSNDDVLVFRVRQYGKLFTTLNATLKGAGGVTPEAVLFDNNNVTQNAATAQAHTGITIDETSTNLFGKTFGIKITGDTSINPSLTANDIYHYIQYHFAQVGTVINGRVGGAWHEMILPGFETQTGTYDGARTVKGVVVVDQNDNEFPGFSGFQSDDGTFHIAPQSATLTLTGLQPNSEVRIYLSGTATEVAGVENSGTAFNYSYTYTADFNVDIVVHSLDYEYLRIGGVTLTANDSSLPIQQRLDRNYENPA